MLGVVAVLGVVVIAWLGARVFQASSALTTAAEQIAQLEGALRAQDDVAARKELVDLQRTTERGRAATSDVTWRLAAHIPWVGPNFAAVMIVAAGVDDVADHALPSVLATSDVMDLSSLTPVDGQIDLAPLIEAAPFLTRAADAAEAADDAVASIVIGDLVGAIAEPVAAAQAQLHDLAGTLRTGQQAATLLPLMLGAEGPRSYLVLLQTNAELRATGGMPGALSVITADDGRIAMREQSTAGAVQQAGLSDIDLSAEDRALFSDRMGVYLADVNFTPHFPTAADLAQQMWEEYSGQRVDGVLATDPVALSYLLAATGPVPDGAGGEVSADNAVETLMSDAYVRFPDTSDQNDYFAAVAASVFESLIGGGASMSATLPALARAAREHRLLVWSAYPDEQAHLEASVLSGAMPAVDGATSEVGVFFNDGTGSKMDYYLNTSVEVVASDCAAGAVVHTVRVTLENTAPADAATSLSPSVTGPGVYGAAPGSIATSVVLIGPVGGSALVVESSGRPIGTATHQQGRRPASVFSVVLDPGETAVHDVTMTDPTPGKVLDVWSTPTKDEPGLVRLRPCDEQAML